ncbi:MAG TPA: hypothetical protein VI795_03415 [Patescibacteria group bacterium]|nr:hypothetical protein [Patescibacteria group bacterium]
MEEQQKPNRDFLWLVLAVIGFSIIAMFEAYEIHITMWISWFIVLMVVIGIAYLAPRLRWPIIFIVIILTIWQGVDLLLAEFDLPIARLTVVNEVTYVAPPSDIDDPELRQYEEEKMGFDDQWLSNTVLGTYLLFCFSYALAQLLQIYAYKNNFEVLYVPVQVIIFVVGAIVLSYVLWPTSYTDPATAEAENRAVFIGAFGPFLWSTMIVIIGFAMRYTGMVSRLFGNVGVVLFSVLSYPVFGGLLQLVNLDLAIRLSMSFWLTNSSITIQRWTELQLMGRFAGMFIPPTVAYFFSILKYILSKYGLLP